MLGFLLRSVWLSIRRTPMLSLLAIATVALGIGVTIPMMAVYHHMHANPMPEKGERLFRVTLDNWAAERPFREPDTAPPALTWRDARQLSQAPGPLARAGMYAASTIVDPDRHATRPFKVTTRVTESGFFAMFEPRFTAGGGWDARADAGKEAVAVVSQALAERLFGADAAVGRQVRINGRELTVVGVLAPWELTPVFYDMQQPFAAVEELFVPLSLAFDLRVIPEWWRSPAILPASLTDASFESLFVESEVVFVQYWVEFAQPVDAAAFAEWLDAYVVEQKALGRFPRKAANTLYDVEGWIQHSLSDSQDAGGVVALIVVMLLFYSVCLLNTVNLLLTKFMRGSARICILRALGASSRLIFVQHVTEVALIAAVGGILGILVALFGLDFGNSLFTHGATAGSGALSDTGGQNFWRLDATMAITSVLLAVAGGLAAGIYPAWRACRVSPASGLKSI